MEIHDRVRLIRKSKGIFQKHVADQIQITTAAYCMKEKGLRPFKVDELQKIASLLNVDPGIFFDVEINELRIEAGIEADDNASPCERRANK